MSSHRRKLVTFGIVLLIISTGTAATASPGTGFNEAYDGKLGPGASELSGINPLGSTAGDHAARYGSAGTPGVFVYYANDSYTSLESWANTSTDRRILENNPGDRRALVTAPRKDLGLTATSKLFDGGLASKSYVDHLALNLNVQYTEPVALEDESAFSRPASNLLVSGSWSPSGIAFSGDAPHTTPRGVRNITGADTVTATGQNITAGVCDTGVNTDSGTVFGNGTAGSQTRIKAAHNFVTDEPGNASNGFQNLSDGNGHGAWVASALAANTSDATYDGMAPNTDLVIGKALNDEGEASTDQIAACVEYMETQEVDVLSLSVGSPMYSPVLADELDDFLAGNGTVALVAAGNSRMRPAGGRYVNSPADTPHDGVLAIAATNARSASDAESAYFSSVGPDASRDLSNAVTAGQEIDLAAPGMNTSARTIDENGYHRNATLSGTSMATPYAAGAAALFLSENPAYVNDTTGTARYLRDTTTAMPHAGTSEVGQGMVDVSKLTALDESGQSQSDARNADATARDKANEAYSGARILHYLPTGS